MAENTEENALAGSIKNEGVVHRILGIVEWCLKTNFSTTLIALCITGIVVACIVYGVSPSFTLNISDVSMGSFFRVAVGGALVSIFCTVFILSRKVGRMLLSISESKNESRDFNKAIVDQLSLIRQDMSGFVTMLEHFGDSSTSMSESVSMMMKLISDDIIDTKRIISVLSSLYNSMKNRPSKSIVMDMLVIRTKMLSVNLIEAVNEYFSVMKNNCHGDIIVESSRSKNRFLLDKLNVKFDVIRQNYFEEIYHLSRHLIDSSIEELIYPEFDSLFSRVNDYVSKGTNISEIIFYIIEDIRKMSYNMETIYSQNINLLSVFDEGGEGEQS